VRLLVEAPISKCVEEDDGYHVKGALVVAPERALQFAVEQLCRIIREFKDFLLFVISPVTRYVSMPCCYAPDHVTNYRDPDFFSSIIADLTKLKYVLTEKETAAGYRPRRDRAYLRPGMRKRACGADTASGLVS
jgi:hypothetical protein